MYIHLNCILIILCTEKLAATPIIGVPVTSNAFMPYPYMVSLQMKRVVGNVTTYQHICGGSLLSSSSVLTAAHCVQHIDPSALVVVIGALNLVAASTAPKYEIARVVFFNYIPNNMQNDIALLKLKINYTLKAGSYAKLPTNGMKANRQIACKAIGYGATNATGGQQNELREAAVFVISKQLCRHRVGAVWAPRNTDNSFCALGVHQDSCQGDSGGPLLCLYNGEYLIYGIISYGVQCGLNDMPSMYTATIPFAKYIKSFMQSWSNN